MKIGSLVECIQEPNIRDTHCPLFGEKFPIKGSIYTVRCIETLHWKGKTATGITLYELKNPTIIFGNGIGERFFRIELFREVLPPIANIEEHIKEQTLEIEFV